MNSSLTTLKNLASFYGKTHRSAVFSAVWKATQISRDSLKDVPKEEVLRLLGSVVLHVWPFAMRCRYCPK